MAMIHAFWFSPVYHTRLVALTLGEALRDELTAHPIFLEHSQSREKASLHTWDITNHQATPSLNRADFAILAIPVYAGRVPPLAADRLRKIRGNTARAILVATYGNRAYDNALVELAALAKEIDFVPVAAAACIARHTIAGIYAEGRPNGADLADLRAFAKRFAEIQPRTMPPVPGEVPAEPARVFPLPQTVNENCVLCGHCWEECPARAIEPNAPASVNKSLCICCMRCVAICPENARVPDPAFIGGIRQKIAEPCAIPKSNEFFMGEKK